MARIARVVIPGYPHHVTQRGVRSMDIFSSDECREQYLQFMKEQCCKHGLHVLSYCLMSNHAHFVAVPETVKSLALAIGEAHRLYTRMVNFRDNVRGYLFQGRFFSCPLDQRYLLACVRYVERNPVRIIDGTNHAWEYPWSSARFHTGLEEIDPLLGTRKHKAKYSEFLSEIDDWKSFLSTPEDELEILREKTRTGRPCGNGSFISKVEKITNRILRPQKPGPKKKK
jgi:putative transposase